MAKKSTATFSQTLREWKNLAEPKPKYIFVSAITIFGHDLCKLLEPIFAANVINALTINNPSAAYLNLFIVFALILLRNILIHLNFMVYVPMVHSSRLCIQKKVHQKIQNANKSNFADTSKEYILNTIVGNIATIGDFQDKAITKISSFLQLLLTLVIVFSQSWVVGLVILGIALFNFLLLVPINKYIANSKELAYKVTDRIFEETSRSIDGHDVIEEFNAKEMYHNKFVEKCDLNRIALKHDLLSSSLKNNILFIFYNALICAITMYLIYLVSAGTMSLTIYLIVVPYITTCTDLFIKFIDINHLTENLKVSIKRVNTILNFTTPEIKKITSGHILTSGTSLDIVGLNYKNTIPDSPYSGILEDIDMSFKAGQLNIVRGDRRCGKRIIFNMLRRKISPKNGLILFDNINIFDYNDVEYRKNIYYTVRNPAFLDGTIMDNLLVAEKNKKKIYAMCKLIGVYDYIFGLPKKFETYIESGLPRCFLFLLGITRALLIGCKTLMIYEVPQIMGKSEHALIYSTLKRLASSDYTIILFTHTSEYDNIAYLTYEMDAGKVTSVSSAYSKKTLK